MKPHVSSPEKHSPPIRLTNAAGEVFVTLQQEPHYLVAIWAGHITETDVITAARASIPLFEHSHCPGLLNDKSGVTGDWFEANDWLQYEWLPKVSKAGLKYFAQVQSTNMLSLYAYRDFRRRMPKEITLKSFHTHKAAKEWLEHKINKALIKKPAV